MADETGPGVGTPKLTVAVAGQSRLKLGVGAVVVLLVLGLAVTVVVTLLSTPGEHTDVPDAVPTDPSTPQTTGEPPAALFVHVSGAVAQPGVYELDDGARVVDAIALAGGFAADADQAAINLARFVADGEQLYVPLVGEAPPPSAGTGNGAGPGASGAQININHATVEELDTLPRVGPALAQRIIDWREEHGPFGAVEDLLEVSGIGEKTLDGFRDQISVS